MNKTFGSRHGDSSSDNPKSKIKNPKFAPLVGAMLFALSSSVEAQQGGHRIGYLTQRPAEAEQHWIVAFQQRLRELAYVEGKNLAIELRRAPVGKPERLRELAAALARMKLDAMDADAGGSGPKVISDCGLRISD